MVAQRILEAGRPVMEGQRGRSTTNHREEASRPHNVRNAGHVKPHMVSDMPICPYAVCARHACTQKGLPVGCLRACMPARCCSLLQAARARRSSFQPSQLRLWRRSRACAAPRCVRPQLAHGARCLHCMSPLSWV